MLKVKNINMRFNGLNVLDDVSFEYAGNGVLGIVGPNGSGKTTMLNIIGGNIIQTKGDITYEGKILNHYSLYKRAALGIVRTYQNGKVFPSHTLKEHLLLIKGIQKSNIANADIKKMLHRFGLEEKEEKLAATLSFGQKRRLELAMAMMRSDAKLYLFDEPTSGVDSGFIEEFKEILHLLRKSNKGIIIIEHNLDLMKEIADQLIVLEGGKILATGSPAEVLQRQDVHDAYLGGVNAS